MDTPRELSLVEDSTPVCGDTEIESRGLESLTEPLISETHSDTVRTQSNDSLDTNDGSHELPTHREDEESNNYVPLIDGHAGEGFADYDDNQIETYPLDPRRFAILAIFCLNNLVGSAAWITFAPIEDAVKAKFKQYGGDSSSTITSQQINWLSMISMAVYGPGTALCAWVVPKYGFRETVIVSSITMALGCFLRWLSFVSTDGGVASDGFSSVTARYCILLTGQGLVALGQTIFMNAPARVAASWFQQTTKSIGMINLCSNLGIVFGQALSPLCVITETGEHLDQLLVGQAAAMGICTLFTGFSFRYEEPAYPPSAAESVRRRERDLHSGHSSSPDPMLSPTSRVSTEIQKLLTNPQYIMLMVAFGINYGLNGAIMTLMQPWLASSGFPGDEMAGLFGSLLIGGGVFATWIASILLDFTRNFNQAIRWSFASTTIVAIGLVASLHPECPTWILATTFTITGMTQMPLLTICCDAVAAHTYPISEELSSAGLQMVGQYLGIVLVDGMSYLIESAPSGEDNDNKTYGFKAKVNIAYLLLLFVSTALAWCYKSDDLRANIMNDRRMLQNSRSLTTTLFGEDNSHSSNSGNDD